MYQCGQRKFFLAMMIALSVVSCSGTTEYLMVGGSQAPGADGMIIVEEVDEGGVLVTLHMERLPPPRQLGDEITSYLVWFEGYNKKPIKAGVLTYRSETRTGDIMKTCPFSEFKMKVTAERDAKAKEPSALVVAERMVKPE